MHDPAMMRDGMAISGERIVGGNHALHDDGQRQIRMPDSQRGLKQPQRNGNQHIEQQQDRQCDEQNGDPSFCYSPFTGFVDALGAE